MHMVSQERLRHIHGNLRRLVLFPVELRHLDGEDQ
jgi:hypothetical protein